MTRRQEKIPEFLDIVNKRGAAWLLFFVGHIIHAQQPAGVTMPMFRFPQEIVPSDTWAVVVRVPTAQQI